MTTRRTRDRSERARAKREARSQLAWGLLFLAGLVLPLAAAVAAGTQPLPVRLGLTLLALALCDAPLVVAGATGRGAVSVIQPWRWGAYLFWLGVRLAMLTLAVLLGRGG